MLAYTIYPSYQAWNLSQTSFMQNNVDNNFSYQWGEDPPQQKYKLLTSEPNFTCLPFLEVCPEPPVLEAHTWRMLIVPDLKLGGWVHP